MVFKFRGDRARSGASGPPGPDGDSAYQIAVANGFVGTEAQWLASLVGPQGNPGINATITAGPVTTLPAGSPATVTNTGSASSAVFAFGIPAGAQGIQGVQGNAATVTVGSTTTGTPSTPASVTNVGTSSAAVLNFVIPKGDKGDQGDPGISKRIVTLSGTTDANGNVSFTFSPAFAATPHISVSMQGAIYEFTRIAAVSASAVTISAYIPNTLTVLGLSVLGLGTSPITGRTIRIMATEM